MLGHQIGRDPVTPAELLCLLNWAVEEALSLRHASQITVRERRKIAEVLLGVLTSLRRSWDANLENFGEALTDPLQRLLDETLPAYLAETQQVLGATEWAGAFPDTDQWAALYEALSEEQLAIHEALEDEPLMLDGLEKLSESNAVWDLLGFGGQDAYESYYSPDFQALQKRANDEERRLLGSLLVGERVSEEELLAQGYPRAVIIDTVSALAKSKLIHVSEDSVFTLNIEGRRAVQAFLDTNGNN
jgi:hypothetical protein